MNTPRRARALLPWVTAAIVSCAVSGGSPPATLPLSDPDLMRAQREVWEAWFAGDTTRLRELTPGLITIDNGETVFGDQASAVEGSARFHANGGRLLALDFPDMRSQRFGDVAILYSTYRLVLLSGADTMRRSGRATEIFVRQHGKWVNPGWHLDSVDQQTESAP